MFNPKILIISTIFLIIFSGCIAENTNKTTIQEGILTIGISPDLPPISYLDGENPAGFEIDLITEIAKRMGLTPEFKIYEFSSLLNAVENNKIDCAVALIAITPERENKVDFSRCYFKTYTTILVKENNACNGLKCLENKKVGVLKGSIQESLMEGFLDDMNFELVHYENQEYMHKDLLSGNINSEVCESLTAKNLINDRNYSLKIVGDQMDINYDAIAVNSENDDLKKAINAAILEMENDGTLVQLKEKWNID
ncbi:extracellular solute-binding protein [Methanococcus maripaludis X1]|uniref:Extracellular solute-binding protein n=1 Tax=Methanococcus maripaludis X1 TaxID=1053692 RepID=G0H3I6_METMI|nr:ABC transporter substrate-binding protein [Methanococcus maripaludis]AEK19376.1 extracellular solute-binding protein [Methanococcus maripaludis X1]